MAETRHIQLPIVAEEAKGENGSATDRVMTKLGFGKHKRWTCIFLCTIFLLCGQSVALLLGRLYFDKGGKSKWLATLVQFAGFPVLIPFYFISWPKLLTANSSGTASKQPSVLKLGLVYVTFGLILAGNGFLNSVGMQYLPVSTVTLISASQLAFNAFFSYFLNSQKFTPFIINSLVLLTISSVLLVFHDDSSRLAGVSRGEYAAGFICTIFGTAGAGLLFALQQLALRKLLLKGQKFKVVFDLVIGQTLTASIVILVGLFASGEWKWFNGEMEEYGLGKFSYIMVLLWTAICWMVFTIGAVGLVLEVSALFCNAISTLGLPIVPIIAVFVFNDKMDGIKVISMVLAIWGFISYVYQQYLDDYKPKIEKTSKTSEACSST
ncbi:hypothetical protein V6N13_119890 [Hibiscus sabdariffa]|uniref:Probable purine permease n=1 Tax=Hibiscus sabdariffa TaxID=183260 RepID=A0ABR2E3Y4_9ROSI